MEQTVIFNAPLLLPVMTFGMAYLLVLRSGFSKPSEKAK